MPDLRDGVDWARSSHFHALRDLMRSTVKWDYLSATQPTGMATAAQALYKFDGTGSALTDRTGNGHTLTLGAGATFYQSRNGLVGLGCSGSEYYTAAASGSLQPTGAITAEFICAASTIGQMALYSIDASGGTSASNCLASLYTASSTNKFIHWTETSSGTDHIVTFNSMMPVGEIVHVTETRTSAGTSASIWINGLLVDTQTVTQPTGGSSSFLTIADLTSGTSGWIGEIYSAKFTLAEFNAAQVLESYQRVRGLVS